MGDWNPERLKVWHEELMDYIILNPRASRDELAEHFSCTVVTITNITTSDLFRLQLEKRRERMALRVESSALERLQGKVARLATASVEKLTDAVESGKADLDGIRDTCDMALKALGYGGSGPAKPAVTNTVQVVVVDANTLAEARARMRGALSPQIEHERPALPAA